MNLSDLLDTGGGSVPALLTVNSATNTYPFGVITGDLKLNAEFAVNMFSAKMEGSNTFPSVGSYATFDFGKLVRGSSFSAGATEVLVQNTEGFEIHISTDNITYTPVYISGMPIKGIGAPRGVGVYGVDFEFAQEETFRYFRFVVSHLGNTTYLEMGHVFPHVIAVDDVPGIYDNPLIPQLRAQMTTLDYNYVFEQFWAHTPGDSDTYDLGIISYVEFTQPVKVTHMVYLQSTYVANSYVLGSFRCEGIDTNDTVHPLYEHDWEVDGELDRNGAYDFTSATPDVFFKRIQLTLLNKNGQTDGTSYTRVGHFQVYGVKDLTAPKRVHCLPTITRDRTISAWFNMTASSDRASIYPARVAFRSLECGFEACSASSTTPQWVALILKDTNARMSIDGFRIVNYKVAEASLATHFRIYGTVDNGDSWQVIVEALDLSDGVYTRDHLLGSTEAVQGLKLEIVDTVEGIAVDSYKCYPTVRPYTLEAV